MAKRVRNKMISIQDMDETIRRGDSEIAEVATRYFQDLYQSSCASNLDFESVFCGFQARVTADTNTELTQAVNMEEIKQPVFGIGPHKAPGPDGFSGAFYQQFWNELNPKIFKKIQGFLDDNSWDRIHNHTNICLLPKVEGPTTMTDFRPIALCNVSYKIISKILVNRLKKHLSNIVSANQVAFTPGRMISDNIIIAHELFHALKARKRQSKCYMALKTDITKAYDKLEWGFLEETMRRMGFAGKWIHWIMACVTTVSYSVLINGSPHGHVIPERGIRQGDPMSPYLFILCAEVLSHMMNTAASRKQIQGLKICNQGTPITHLLFADDSLFFLLANDKSCKAIQNILSTYEKVSGQAVNLRKSAITFGSRVRSTVKTRMRRILGIHNEGDGGKYLGLPETVIQKKTEMFQFIIDKVKEKTQGWSKKYVSWR